MSRSTPKPHVESPFAQLLTRAWAWKQEPPLTGPTEIGRVLGVQRQTVWQWLHKGTRPDVAVLPQIADRTGLPLRELYAAAGYPPPPPDPGPSDPWQPLLEEVAGDPRLGAAARATLLEHIEDMRRIYADALQHAQQHTPSPADGDADGTFPRGQAR